MQIQTRTLVAISTRYLLDTQGSRVRRNPSSLSISHWMKAPFQNPEDALEGRSVEGTPYPHSSDGARPTIGRFRYSGKPSLLDRVQDSTIHFQELIKTMAKDKFDLSVSFNSQDPALIQDLCFEVSVQSNLRPSLFT